MNIPTSSRSSVASPRVTAERRGGRFRRSRERSVASVLLGTSLLLTLAACNPLEPQVDYPGVAAGLPDMSDLAARATPFRSTLIYDRDGNLLNEAFDPNAGRRTVVALDAISPHLRQATIATEDARFYEHSGVDPIAVGRAVWYIVQEGEVVSGGSTIPQQLVKRLYLTPERSVRRKVVEAALATEISKQYGKDQILELYLNEIFYGNLAYGAQAAARTYFGKDAADLTLAEGALLAGLPQAPAYYDPYANPDRAKARQEVVLGLMADAGYITPDEVAAATAAPLAYVAPRFDLNAPHFTLFVREQVEQLFGPEALYARGLVVTTSLDPHLQAAAERIVREHVATLADRHVTNGALVAIRPNTGEILAMVGSADFTDEAIAGQVNMALSPRQPGSAIKPLLYLAAFDGGTAPQGDPWTPGSLVADITAVYPGTGAGPYVPTNYDGEEHGMVTVCSALANSYNIPAVRTLAAIGVPALGEMAARLGVTTLTRDDYGLPLALGSGEVPLVELTGAYAVLAAGGDRRPSVTIVRITESSGEVLCALGSDRPCLPGGEPGVQRSRVVDPVDAFLVTDILADDAARVPAFGTGSWLEIGRPAAVKTGTTNDVRDGWTVGYTPQLVTGVWVGNADNTPMRGLSGFGTAAPIWNRFMRVALEPEPVLAFDPPAGVRQYEVCADTGALPAPSCPARAVHWFAADRPPLAAERDLYQVVRIDRLTGRLATDYTPADAVEERAYKVYPVEFRAWAEAHGIPQPPTEGSDVFDRAARVSIDRPVDGAEVEAVVRVVGTIDVPLLDRWAVRLRPAGGGPFGEEVIAGTGPVTGDLLGFWDTRGVANGAWELRLRAHDTLGHTHDYSVIVVVGNALPTSTASPTALGLPPSPTPAPATQATATPVPLIVLPVPSDTPHAAPPVPSTPSPEPIGTPAPLPSPPAGP